MVFRVEYCFILLPSPSVTQFSLAELLLHVNANFVEHNPQYME